MFEVERFIEDCRRAVAEDASHKAVREVVARAGADSAAVRAALGEPTEAGIEKLYHGADLTVLTVVWAPQMSVMPHDHRM